MQAEGILCTQGRDKPSIMCNSYISNSYFLNWFNSDILSPMGLLLRRRRKRKRKMMMMIVGTNQSSPCKTAWAGDEGSDPVTLLLPISSLPSPSPPPIFHFPTRPHPSNALLPPSPIPCTAWCKHIPFGMFVPFGSWCKGHG